MFSFEIARVPVYTAIANYEICVFNALNLTNDFRSTCGASWFVAMNNNHRILVVTCWYIFEVG